MSYIYNCGKSYEKYLIYYKKQVNFFSIVKISASVENHYYFWPYQDFKGCLAATARMIRLITMIKAATVTAITGKRLSQEKVLPVNERERKMILDGTG